MLRLETSYFRGAALALKNIKAMMMKELSSNSPRNNLPLATDRAIRPDNPSGTSSKLAWEAKSFAFPQDWLLSSKDWEAVDCLPLPWLKSLWVMEDISYLFYNCKSMGIFYNFTFILLM